MIFSPSLAGFNRPDRPSSAEVPPRPLLAAAGLLHLIFILHRRGADPRRPDHPRRPGRDRAGDRRGAAPVAAGAGGLWPGLSGRQPDCVGSPRA